MDELEDEATDVLRIDLPLDEELVEALMHCSQFRPGLCFAEIVRDLLLREAVGCPYGGTITKH